MVKRPFQLLFIMGVFALVVSSCAPDVARREGSSSLIGKDFTSDTGSGPNSTTGPDWGLQLKTSGCLADGSLQDKACTPGDIIKSSTKEQICTPGYARKVRSVSQSLKNDVYASYGITKRKPGAYQVDHLVSLQLGGSNDISNLWPEAASPKPGYHEKDKVENYLHDQLCDGDMSLAEVQNAIATDWVAVYNSMPPDLRNNSSDDNAGEGS